MPLGIHGTPFIVGILLGGKYVQTILFFLKPSNQAVKMRRCIFLPLFHTVLLLCTVKIICFSPSFCKIRKKVLSVNTGNTVYPSIVGDVTTCTLHNKAVLPKCFSLPEWTFSAIYFVLCGSHPAKTELFSGRFQCT